MSITKSKAKSNYLMISPFKIRRVAKLVRGKDLASAISVLQNMPHKSCRFLLKTILSALSNLPDPTPELSKVFIKTLLINEGPRHKRQCPRARGRMDIIVKRTSHIYVELEK